nr:MAG TPA: hypothetical protein [Caudoviricetes sp.]
MRERISPTIKVLYLVNNSHRYQHIVDNKNTRHYDRVKK